MSASLAEVVLPHVGRADLTARVRELYAELDAVIGALGPLCTNRGACCKFADYGHRLYVTGVELAHFLGGQGGDWRAPADANACPYQVGGLCTAREHRPLGCRVFFCDSAAKDWQNPLYERFLATLRRIGEELGVEYRYVEWLSALAEMSAAGGTTASAVNAPPREPRRVSDVPAAVDRVAPGLIQLGIVAGGNAQTARDRSTPVPTHRGVDPASVDG